MRIIKPEPLSVGWLVTRMQPSQWTATFFVKAAYRLRPGAPVEPMETPEPVSGDRQDGDDLVYPSDFVPCKPRTDLLILGSCHAPGGAPVLHAGFRVGSVSKEIRVIGDRVRRESDPIPFTRIRLRYRLPNVEKAPGSPAPDPPGFGPIPASWPQRASLTGTFDKKWLKERWPGYPEDFDYRHFNAAPADQQPEAPMRGDEELEFLHMHPAQPRYRSRLPGTRARCFIEERRGDTFRFREVPLVLDTLWADVDEEKLVLVWRGRAAVDHVRMPALQNLYALLEPLDAPALGAEAWRERMLQEIAAADREFEETPPAPAPAFDEAAWRKSLAGLPQQIEQEIAEGLKVLSTLGPDVSAQLAASGHPGIRIPVLRPLPPQDPAAVLRDHLKLLEAHTKGRPDLFKKFKALAEMKPAGLPEAPAPRPAREERGWTRESVLQAVAAGQDLRGQDLKGLDLHGADLSRAKLCGADLSGCALAGADLSRASLEEADFSRADLTGAKLAGASLRFAEFSGAKLARAVFDGAEGRWMFFTGADLSEATFRKARLLRPVFAESNAAKADFTASVLDGADFEAAKAPGARFDEADLTGFRAGSSPDFTGASFRKIVGTKSTWEAAILSHADFTEARLSRADFTACRLDAAVFQKTDLSNAVFDDAVLAGASLLRANACKASFERTDLSKADLRGANFYQAEFWDAKVQDADFRESNLDGTKLERS